LQKTSFFPALVLVARRLGLTAILLPQKVALISPDAPYQPNFCRYHPILPNFLPPLIAPPLLPLAESLACAQGLKNT